MLYSAQEALKFYSTNEDFHASHSNPKPDCFVYPPAGNQALCTETTPNKKKRKSKDTSPVKLNSEGKVVSPHRLPQEIPLLKTISTEPVVQEDDYGTATLGRRAKRR